MGADLCGYILIGPKKLSKSKIREAKRQLRHMIVLARNLQRDAIINSDVISKTFPRVDLYTLNEHGEADILSVIAETEMELLNDFVRLWNHGGSWRDYMCREHKDLRILVVGERTYGDGPQEGSAWWMVEQLTVLGLLDILGIK